MLKSRSYRATVTRGHNSHRIRSFSKCALLTTCGPTSWYSWAISPCHPRRPFSEEMREIFVGAHPVEAAGDAAPQCSLSVGVITQLGQKCSQACLRRRPLSLQSIERNLVLVPVADDSLVDLSPVRHHIAHQDDIELAA